jgi:uroporphyrinogen-III synthase
VTAYRTVSDDTLSGALLESLEQNGIDLVAFTSGSTATHFAAAFPETRRAALLEKVRGASIGPITSAVLRDAGIAVAVEAAESTIPGLTAAIVAHFQERGE